MGSSGRGFGRGRGRGRGYGLVFITSTGGRGRGRGRGGRTSVVATAASNKDIFIQATSSNLPPMSFLKVAEYFRCLRSPELRHAKDDLSVGADCGDSAIGYVQVKSENGIYTVLAKITPETSVNKFPYNVNLCIGENDQSVMSASCNCEASLGNCKHQIALIFWLLRRHEEPAPTDVQCYWKESILSRVNNLKAKSIDELSNHNTDMTEADDSVLKAFIAHVKKSNTEAGVIRHSPFMKQDTLYMDHLLSL